MNNNIQKKKGITLIELLIVIAIIAILGSATVLVLNPVELMAQGRDGTRVNDMDSLRNALNNYVVNNTTVDLKAGTCNVSAASKGCATAGTAGTTNSPFGTAGTAKLSTVGTGTNVTGTGWLPVNFGTNPALSALPLDPTNTATYFYAYGSESTYNTFVVASRLESTKYRDKMKNDGGPRSACGGGTPTWTTDDCWYEIGTASGLTI